MHARGARLVRLGATGHDHAWQGFRTPWEATPGEHLLCARAHDATGRSQPATPVWSRGGFANNALDHVRVVVPDQTPD